MNTKQTFYINSSSLASSTAIYTDAALTTTAPDGFYSDSTATVKQVSGVIVAVYQCETCTCLTQTFGSTSGKALYNSSLIAGSGLGAVIIKITVDEGSAPIGFRAIETFDALNTNYHNKIINKIVGYAPDVPSSYLYPSLNGRFVHVGNSSRLGSCSGNFNSSDYSDTFDVFTLDGGLFSDSGVDESHTIYVSETFLNSYSSADSKYYFMVIPKNNSNRAEVIIQALASCTTNNWSVEVQCPIILTASNVSANTPGVNCDTPVTASVIYNAPVNGTHGTPALYDFVFTDAYGNTPYPDGEYRIKTVAEVYSLITVTNGIITTFTSC